jgi:hypothetical protein
MSQKDGDIAKVDGVTVGGAKFGEDGKWSGNWQPWSEAIDGKSKKKEKLKIEVPAATAVLIRLIL